MTPKTVLATALIHTGDDCFLWPFSVNKRGYPQMWYAPDKTCREVHRIVCILVRGRPRGKFDAAHSCGTPRCISPVHVRWKTRGDNLREGKPRQGEAGPSKLTEAQVRAIRADPRPQTAIAKDYGIGQMTVSNIKTRFTWRHI